MANGDFNLPTLIGSYRSDFLDQIRTSRNVVATMFDGSIAYSNQPIGAVKFTGGVFSKWSASTWDTQAVAVAGGGTGATTAAGARTALSVLSSAEVTALTDALNTAKADKTITISASNGLSGGGDLSANRTISGVNASTSAKGVVQLNNTVTSTSTTQAATANAVKVAYDRASTQVGGGAISGVYYNEALVTLGGDLSGTNNCRVIRVGNTVTISFSSTTHASSSSPNSATGVIPSWAVPSITVTTNVCSVSTNAVTVAQVINTGTLFFYYYDWTGSFKSLTSSPPASISYNIN